MPTPIEIFRAGRHVAMSGEAISFSDADLDGVVGSYDPAVHEAPIVVGHPSDNGPAYGWVKQLAKVGDRIQAMPAQVDPAFAELVKAGRFKKVSASFYKPDSPSNPKPGSYYLRHVGFLGAQPPAVKGLREASFAGKAEDCLTLELEEPSELDAMSNAVQQDTPWGRLRAWIIKTWGLAAADDAIPEAMIGAAPTAPPDGAAPPVADGTASLAEGDATASAPKFAVGARVKATADHGMNLKGKVGVVSEAHAGAPPYYAVTFDGEKDAHRWLNEAELEAETTTEPAPADAASADMSEREKKLVEREARIAEREREQRRAGHASFLESLVRDGRPLPCKRELLVGLLDVLDASSSSVASFGEGEKRSPATILREEVLARLPKQVHFAELAGGGDGTINDDPTVVAKAAAAYQADQASKGVTVSTAQAVRHVKGM